MTTTLYLKSKDFISLLKSIYFYRTGLKEGWIGGFKVVCEEWTWKDEEQFVKEVIKELKEEFNV